MLRYYTQVYGEDNASPSRARNQNVSELCEKYEVLITIRFRTGPAKRATVEGRIIVLAGTRTHLSLGFQLISLRRYTFPLLHTAAARVYTVYTCNRIKRSRIEHTRAACGNPMDSKDFSLLFSTWQRNDVHKLCVLAGYLCYTVRRAPGRSV